jgi:geranylgeranyl diphosphate synthase type 3
MIYHNIKCLVLTETGALFSLGIQLMQLFSENKTDFTKLTGILGLYYQISNDYRNLFRQEVTSELLVLDIRICLGV